MPRPLGPTVLPRAPLVLAHRGWSGRAPENTHAAFQAAAEAGFGFELDVGLASDGTPVIVHDDLLDRTTNGTGYVDRTDTPTLLDLDAGAWFGPAFAGERIPLLRDVLGTWGRVVPIDVEIKPPRRGGPWRARQLAAAVVDVIVALDLTAHVLVTSFDPFVLAAVRRRCPDIARGQLSCTFAGTDLGPFARTVLRHHGLDRYVRPDVHAVDHVLLSRGRVHRAKRRGFGVLAWTVNSPDRARELVAAGVDILVSDHPDRIAHAVRDLEVACPS